jgi:hypothetical protein
LKLHEIAKKDEAFYTFNHEENVRVNTAVRGGPPLNSLWRASMPVKPSKFKPQKPEDISDLSPIERVNPEL